MQGYHILRKQVLSNLEANLPKSLTYHALDHTLDVLKVCNQYIKREKLPIEERYLLRTGAIVHDMGFLKGSTNHEEVGAGMAEVIMKNLGVSQKTIDKVKGLVMATKIPQNPQDYLQRIICDADLDYLGRLDYPEISQKLFEELKNMNVISTAQQWKDLQINFLKAHRYHTPFAIKNREPQKQIWLNKLLDS
ncbi:HD domain-containing protein [uncultured Algoriphagus sp.]|uniref:HD domain-containing protein n=1 Tax=uncultured Algoriphagus sp. TaxID=417365 RepID=UPI0030ECA215|tara:strand:+ start:3774 stop:4349 length:576 start_codon:yes stop_codon:yes gene_type:complete